ncbi:hypothetical protein L0337_26740 [candidate division KSB1 bacterium]|nr:hypothetical protein [candidate division KSB1 bacterium]
MNIAAMVAWLFTKEAIAWWVLPFGFCVGIVQVLAGAWFIQAAHRVNKTEDNTDG